MTYGPWLSRDPCLFGERVQGEWAGNGYSITNHVIVCNEGEAGHVLFVTPFGSPQAGTYRVVGHITNTEDGSGYQPVVFGQFGPELRDEADANGNFDVEFEVTGTPTSASFGLRSTGNGNAQVAVSSTEGRFDFCKVE